MLWLVVLFPLVGAILNGLILPRSYKGLSHAVACLAMAAAFFCSLPLFWQALHSDTPEFYYGFTWIHAGGLNIPFELVLDRLSALMLLVVTGIGTLIHVYAGGYMHDEERTYRFFAYLNLFVFMMLLLVLGNNLLVMFVGWEGVGLCSYLLIGYWYQDSANAQAGMKAFLVNRIGDIGFLLGIFLTYKHFQTLSFSELRAIVSGPESLSPAALAGIGLITLCLFVGACGKSAQLPLYVWLPDAMAGPTPVSALIHAATMVTAGVYMMTRLNFFYYLAPSTLAIVAVVGAATALFAATIAIVQTDIKKVLAYSTVSQLGYMVLACGLGAFDAAVFHLLTHACFKALLFLGAGSVIVAMHHKQDMREMGGLRTQLPITHAVMLVGVLAIIGFPGLSGFFSKDEILWQAFIHPGTGPWLWGIALVSAACTAFYMVRLLCLTFYGPNRSDAHTRSHLHETPALMWAPLTVLALLSIGVGYLGMPPVIADLFGGSNLFAAYLQPNLYIPEQAQSHWAFLEAEHSHAQEWGLMALSTTVALLSAGFAYSLYSRGPAPLAFRLQTRFSAAYKLLLNKYWVDELYQRLFVNPLENMSQFLLKVIDIAGINGAVNGIGRLFMTVSGLTSFSMSGSVHRHAMHMILGLILFFVLLVT